MRVPIVILALVATPFIADVSAAQGQSAAAKSKDECLMPGLRKGHELIDWIAKHFDKSCKPVVPPPPPPPAPTPDPVITPDPTPLPDPTPTPTPDPTATTTSVTGMVFDDL